MDKQISYIIRCDELGILIEFKDFDAANYFAEQLVQDYPKINIERVEFVQYFDNWEV